MQKLTWNKTGIKGSALVGVVTITVLMSIGILSYMGVTRNTIDHEITAYNDARALVAAESGLLVGTRWLRETGNWDNLSDSSVLFDGLIEGVAVKVTAIRSGNTVELQSDASIESLTYKKRISWELNRQALPHVGTFINNMMSGGSPGNGNGNDGFNNITFDGPFHMNSSIILASGGGEVAVAFKGPVTVYNKTQTGAEYEFKNGHSVFTTGDWGNHGVSLNTGNDYTFGIHLNPSSKTGDDLTNKFDQCFEKSFTHSQDSLYIDEITHDSIRLSDWHTPEANFRPTLKFKADGSADYYYGTNKKDSIPEAVLNNRIIMANGDLNVLGTYQGKITVKASGNIYPTGELVAKGFDAKSVFEKYDSAKKNQRHFNTFNSEGNYGLGLDNPNMLALVSDSNIVFTDQWLHPDSGKSVSVSGNADAGNTLYINATIVAKNGSHLWLKSNGSTLGNGDKVGYDRMRLIGSRILDDWVAPYWKGGNNANSFIGFYYDRRLEAGEYAPGMEQTLKSKGSTGELFKLSKAWKESNQEL